MFYFAYENYYWRIEEFKPFWDDELKPTAGVGREIWNGEITVSPAFEWSRKNREALKGDEEIIARFGVPGIHRHGCRYQVGNGFWIPEDKIQELIETLERERPRFRGFSRS